MSDWIKNEGVMPEFSTSHVEVKWWDGVEEIHAVHEVKSWDWSLEYAEGGRVRAWKPSE